MKKISLYGLMAMLLVAGWGCKKDNYPGGKISPYISILDIRNLFKGQELTLSSENMFGSDKIAGVVISDHSGGNLPAGLLILQDSRRLSQTRGIAISIGSDAAGYVPGDSLEIDVTGGVLKRVDGILQITGITNDRVTKISSGNPLVAPILKSNVVLASPQSFESTLISIAKVGFDPSYPPNTTYEGDKMINDGFGNMELHTQSSASFASEVIPFLANYTGIIFAGGAVPQLWPRTDADITVLSATPPEISPVVITGYLVDPPSTDANYEYIQLMATRDIDFAVTPFSVVTTNNAGASTPTGFPTNGWATGDLRTYKIDIAAGSVTKGQYFYVGANKNIWGNGSTDISSAFWVSKMYGNDGVTGDGFGSKTANLLANSGNVAGIALFDHTEVNEESVPVDVIFYGGGGTVFTLGPPIRGYRITSTDYYDLTNPSTLEEQPYYGMGSNTTKLSFPTATNFSKLGGVYNLTTGRWPTARALTNVPLTSASTLAEIEGATTIED